MDKLTLQNVRELFTCLKEMAIENRDQLIELDAVMGDGDLGLTMAAVFTAADKFATEYSGTDIGDLFMRAGMTMSKAAPSTMGTLMATGFMRGGKAISDTREIKLLQMSDFWAAFVDGIMTRGKAKLGDKTIIDAIYPASRSLELSLKNNASLNEAMQTAKTAARDGMELTQTMVAQHGRAAYHQEKSRDTLDPGAVVGSLVIDTFADCVGQ